MLRNAFVLAAFLSTGCASARTNELIAGDAIEPNVIDARTSAPSADALPAETVAEIGRESFAPSIAAPQDALHTSRFTLKAGYYGSEEDALDDGYILGVSWMNFMTRFFALEFEAGYLDADGTESGVDTDLWAIPIFLNGRLNAPLWILDVYGGLGVGTFYYDGEADSTPSVEDDGFVLAGDAFVGATLNLAEALALGLELKYYVTDEISEFDSGLDAYALMVTLGWSR